MRTFQELKDVAALCLKDNIDLAMTNAERTLFNHAKIGTDVVKLQNKSKLISCEVMGKLRDLGYDVELNKEKPTELFVYLNPRFSFHSNE